MLTRTQKTEENFGNIMRFSILPAIVLSGLVEVRGLVQENTDMVLGSMLRATGIAGITLIAKFSLDLKNNLLNHLDKNKEKKLQKENSNNLNFS